MVPFSAFMRVEEQLGMDQINRYNMYSTASVTCNVAPGSSSGEAIQQMEALFKEQLGDEFGYEWTSVAYQETQAGTTTTVVFVMALLVAFLVLAAQYESWTSPVAAVIGLPVALLGAMIGCLIMGTPVSIYTQIGIILLVALSAKNGILIVEFARDFRAQGNSIRDAAFQAGHIRLRPYPDDIPGICIRCDAIAVCYGCGSGKPYCTGSCRRIWYGTEYIACHSLYP